MIGVLLLIGICCLVLLSVLGPLVIILDANYSGNKLHISVYA
jgi:hypothetical protein